MEPPELLAFSLTARRAPLAVRERFALVADDLPHLAAFLRPLVSEALPVSTCHRFELYVQPRHGITSDDVLAGLAAARDFDARELRRYLRIRRGRGAADHLLRVAAGLDSPVLGETQILGQVRRALEAAREQGLIGHRLGTLVQRAISAGKRVQEETGLGRGALSVSRVAVEHARQELGGLADKTVLIVGAGETGQLAGKALGPVGHVLVANRTAARARVLAAQLGGTAVPLSALRDAFVKADLVISCVGAARPVISAKEVRHALAARAGRCLIVVDLALPRSVEAEVGSIAGATLVTLDQLAARRSAHAAGRAREVPRARAIVAAELERAWQSWTESTAHDVVAALRRRAESVREAELARSGRVLDDLQPEQRSAVQALTQAIVNKLLHEPTIWLKAHPTTAPAALQEIFGLGVQA